MTKNASVKAPRAGLGRDSELESYEWLDSVRVEPGVDKLLTRLDWEGVMFGSEKCGGEMDLRERKD